MSCKVNTKISNPLTYYLKTINLLPYSLPKIPPFYAKEKNLNKICNNYFGNRKVSIPPEPLTQEE